MKSIHHLIILLCTLSGCSKLERQANESAVSNKVVLGAQSSSKSQKQGIYCRLYMDAKPNTWASILIQYRPAAIGKNEKGTWIIQKNKADDIGLPFNVKLTAQSEPDDLPYIWLVENEEGFLGKVTWEEFNNVDAMEMTFVSNKFSEPLLGHCVRLSVPTGKAKAKNS